MFEPKNLCPAQRLLEALDAPLEAIPLVHHCLEDILSRTIALKRGDGKNKEEFPHWTDQELVRLGRIDSYNVVPGTRPILLAGEDALAVLSAQTGTVLASTKYPLPCIRRPILFDFDGDGTTDVLVQTREALWGYKIVVKTGSSVFLRILVGLLLMGLLLAMLRNRYGPYPGKRSTDL